MNAVCEYLSDAHDIALEAGRRILDVYEKTIGVDLKVDGSPLTQADTVSHEHIVQALAALTPSIPVLSEESADVPFEERKGWSRFWLVDPLDGTKEFIKRNGEFTVNIALIENGAPVLGVVYVPVLGVSYTACRGRGAFKQKEETPPKPIAVRAIGGTRPIVVASRSHAGPETVAFLQSLGSHDVVSMGSSLKFCLVAEGVADVYPRLGPTMEWDTAAAQCVVECAGGTVTDTAGRVLTYNKSSLKNPWFVVSGADSAHWLQHVERSQAQSPLTIT
jgi:3'(2'), 5'-bisphosphate nucleotidase